MTLLKQLYSTKKHWNPTISFYHKLSKKCKSQIKEKSKKFYCVRRTFKEIFKCKEKPNTWNQSSIIQSFNFSPITWSKTVSLSSASGEF